MRSDEGILEALVPTNELPVAVLNLETLVNYVGSWEPIKGVSISNAVRLKTITNHVFDDYFDVDNHIWVNPSYYDYRKAWVNAGLKKPMNPKEQIDFRLANELGSVPSENFLCVRQLDHIHSKGWATKEGYGYVLLMDVSSGPNMGAGSIEKNMIKECQVGYAKERSVRHANEIHWAKLWDLNQFKRGQPMRETPGIRVR